MCVTGNINGIREFIEEETEIINVKPQHECPSNGNPSFRYFNFP